MTQKGLTNSHHVFTVTAKEQWLIEEVRKVRFGRAEVVIEEHQPTRIVKIEESVKYPVP